jgi:hypothetical protein
MTDAQRTKLRLLAAEYGLAASSEYAVQALVRDALRVVPTWATEVACKSP